MDIRQLKAFIAVFEERNITTAANLLHITQPTLSVTIRQLEEELGTHLFTRQARGVKVTEDARLLYPQARRLIDQANAVSSLFRERAHLPLTLGIESDLASSHIESFLRQAHRADATLKLTVLEGCTGDARLAAEESRCEDELFVPLWEEAFALAIPSSHPLATTDTPSTAQLADAAWITCPTHPSHQRLLALHNQIGISTSLTRAAHAGSLALTRHMVAAGIGLALLPQAFAQEHPDITVHAFSELALTRRIGLCYAAQAQQNPAVQALLGGLGKV